MAKKSVTFIEIGVYQKMLPLVSGYLQSYATTDPDIKAYYSFDIYTSHIDELI